MPSCPVERGETPRQRSGGLSNRAIGTLLPAVTHAKPVCQSSFSADVCSSSAMARPYFQREQDGPPALGEVVIFLPGSKSGRYTLLLTARRRKKLRLFSLLSAISLLALARARHLVSADQTPHHIFSSPLAGQCAAAVKKGQAGTNVSGGPREDAASIAARELLPLRGARHACVLARLHAAAQ